MNLFLFTNYFPYETSEQFIVNEFEFAKQYYQDISILSLYGKNNISPTQNSIGTVNSGFVMVKSNTKLSLLFNGLFNLAPFHHHLFEFFSRKIFLSPQKTYWLFVSMLITRATLSSTSYKQLINKVAKQKKSTLYFYWGDNLCWLIPYLYKKIKKNESQIAIRLHANDLYEHVKANYAPLRCKIFSLCDKIITISDDGKNYLQTKYPEIRHKLLSSPLGVFDHGLNPTFRNKKFVITSVSNLVSKKRVHLILETLQKTNFDIIWHHFGDGPLREDLLNRTKNSRSGLEIIVHGHVENNELMTFYKTNHVDLFLNVSSSEGIPVAIMEALSFGIPVIATNVGGVSEIINNDVGTLIEPDFGVEYLAELISKFSLLDKQSLAKLKKKARATFLKKTNASKNYKYFYEMLRNSINSQSLHSPSLKLTERAS